MDEEEKLRQRILEKLDDLKNKIETNEDFPESKQDMDSLVYIDDGLEEILNSWYY